MLHQGKIAELKTGEGKTLVATLPLYLNALEGRGAHLVTVNDYLAKRDAQWYGRVSAPGSGSRVGVLQHESAFLVTRGDGERRRGHGVPDAVRAPRGLLLPTSPTARTTSSASTTCATTWRSDWTRYQVQRETHYAIVDEVDNILIDEARTPLIISGPAQDSTARLPAASRALAPQLDARDRLHGRREAHGGLAHRRAASRRSSALLQHRQHLLAGELPPDPLHGGGAQGADHLPARPRLRGEGRRDRHRRRLHRPSDVGRRWSDGLHQAVEAKEGVKIQQESITYATITLQNYFRLYDKLAGMTGTAVTEAEEFDKIYKLEVVVIPTNRPMVRDDEDDLVYRTSRRKFDAVAEEIEEHARRRAGRCWSAPSRSRSPSTCRSC